MEGAIKTVVQVFLKSSKGKENLGAKDFQSLVKNQLKNILTDTESSDAIKTMRKDLDTNKDGKVSFPEYMMLVGSLAQSVSEYRCEKETQAANSTPETQAEVPAASKHEPEPEPEPEPENEAVPAKVEEQDDKQDEVVEVVEVRELVESVEEEEEEDVEEVKEVVEST